MKNVYVSALVVALCASSFAATVTKLNDDAFAPLRASSVARHIQLDRLPIYDGTRSVIDLEEFQVWAPDGKVVIHGDHGVVLKTVDPPPMRFFRGLVNGDPESFAYFSMDPAGRQIEGLIVTRDKKFSVNSVRRERPDRSGKRDDSSDVFLTEYNDMDAIDDNPRPWQCGVDETKLDKNPPMHAIGANGLPLTAQGISGTQSYAIRVDIETDFELFQNAGSNATTLTNYVTNLSGAVSTIYNRDLKTNLVQGTLNIYTTSSDPWAATNSNAGLSELGDHYHSCTSCTGAEPSIRTTSAVIMLSGKNTNDGIAWLNVICRTADFFSSGHWGGPYAWCGSIAVAGIPDPNATVNSVLYGLPQSNYWPLDEYAHELGHIMAGEHTHCIALTAAEQTSTGRSFVDSCFYNEGAGCVSDGGSAHFGTLTDVPPEKGTIMSYCHDIFSAGFPQSRFLFGLGSEVSHHQLDDYMLRSGGPISGSGNNVVSAVGNFTISAITAPSSVGANSTGNTASITASPSTGATYAWTITNGTITSASNTNSITFTAAASGTVTLRATAYGTNFCGVTDTKSITIASVNPPAGVTAAAATSTSVSISWTAATGATAYHIYRSADHVTFAQVPGSPSGTSFTDATAAANTAYLYKVRSFDGTSESSDSNADLATTVIFTDPSLTSGVTVKAAHFTELRTAVNAVHVLAGLGSVTFTDTLDSTMSVKATHMNELRSNLDAARLALGLTALSYTDSPTVAAGSTAIKAAHITELRGGVQ